MSHKKALVTIYGAEWCPPCHMAKGYLKSQHVDYDYIDIDKDRQAGMEIAQQTGWTAIPIIKISDEYMLGFDRPKIDLALRANKLI
jgi:glutaredoxin 3